MKKNLLIIILSIGFLFTATALSAQKVESNEALKYRIDNYLKDGVSNGFSGSILIVKEGRILLNEGYGMADKENNIPYTPQTVATIGSVTKQFTATAILKLVESNKLKTTDPISRFFKDIPDDKRDITIHQLLSHTAGLIDVIGEGDFDDIPRKKFFKVVFASDLLHQPGSKYAYSNAGYSILARIIELTSGQDYERFLYENLFKPAGMMETGYFIPKWKDESIAKGYVYGFINVGSMIQRYQRMGKITWTLKGNGGIHSTPGDMYKWYKALQSNQIISKSSFEKLSTRYIEENEAGTSYYGYGWAIYESDRKTKIISHNGGNGIYFHDFIWMPEEDALILLFTNMGSKEGEVAWTIEKMLFDEAYIAAPIKKNLHLLVIDFIRNNSLKEAGKLIDKIKDQYLSTVSHPDVLNGLGYDLMELSDNNIGWALEIFKLNVELFPENGNNWDSLGEGYLLNGQRELSLESYKKALELAPDSNCNWCENSSKAVEKISKMK